MTPPPPKKSKESNVITMVIEKWAKDQMSQYSAVHRINGFPWRIRLCSTARADERALFLQCEKWREAELWTCIVQAKVRIVVDPSHSRPPLGGLLSSITMKSWHRRSQKAWIADDRFPDGSRLEVELITNDDGESWRRRPVLDPLESRDGFLVVGEEHKKIQIHKESLASQSSYFDCLFNGDFKEKNMVEIPIAGVESESFTNIIRMVYGFDGASLTDENVHSVLDLADRFNLKIVEDRVTSYLLSTCSTMPIHQKLLIAEHYALPFLKDRLISMYTGMELSELSDSEEFNQLSFPTVRALFKRSCELIPPPRFRLSNNS